MQRFTQAVFRAFKPSLDATAATLPDLDTYWEKNLAPAVKCSEYLNDYLFPQVSDPKTLIIDGTDRVLGQETWEGFSGFLRAFFEEKMKKVSLNQKITAPHLVIAYSTEPYAKYEVGGSPLANVGLAVDLEEFNADQILELAQRYHLDWDKFWVKQLMGSIGGHPELVNRFLYQISQEHIPPRNLLNNQDALQLVFQDYLLSYLNLLNQHSQQRECFYQIIQGQQCSDEFAKFQLEKAGLTQRDENQVVVRNELYKTYFLQHLSTLSENS